MRLWRPFQSIGGNSGIENRGQPKEGKDRSPKLVGRGRIGTGWGTLLRPVRGVYTEAGTLTV